MMPVSAGSGGSTFKYGFSNAKRSTGCLCVSRWIRTLATVSIQWRAAVLRAFKPEGNSNPARKFFFTYPTPLSTRAFFVCSPYVAGAWFEAVVSSEVEVSRMKERPFPDGMVQHCSLKIVDEDFGRNPPEELQGILVGGQEVLRCFAQGKLDVAQPAVAEHHDKEGEPSTS